MQLVHERPVSEQLQQILQRVQANGEPEQYGWPQLTFYQKLRQIDFEYLDYNKQYVQTQQNIEVHGLHFSLLPNQTPLDDGCYLKMQLVTTEDGNEGRKSIEGTSSLWIYGQQAKLYK